MQQSGRHFRKFHLIEIGRTMETQDARQSNLPKYKAMNESQITHVVYMVKPGKKKQSNVVSHALMADYERYGR